MDEAWEDPKESLRVLSAVARAGDEWKALYDASNYRVLIRSLKHSRLLGRYYYREFGKVERRIGLSILTYGLTMLIRALAGAWDKLRHMRIRLPRQQQVLGRVRHGHRRDVVCVVVGRCAISRKRGHPQLIPNPPTKLMDDYTQPTPILHATTMLKSIN